jgi:hypothetical protein
MNRHNWRLGEVALSAVLTTLMPGMFWIGSGIDISLPFLGAALISCYSGFKLARLAFAARPYYLQITFWLFVYVWLGIAASLQIGSGIYPWPSDQCTPENILMAELVIITGLVAFETAIVRTVRRSAQSRSYHFLSSKPGLVRYLLMCGICAGMATYGIVLKGGVANVMVTRARNYRLANAWNLSKQDFLISESFLHTPSFVALLVGIFLLKSGWFTGFRRNTIIVTVVLLSLLNLVTNFPASLARYWLGTVLLSLAILLFQHRKGFRPCFVLGMALVLLLLFPYSDYFRTDSGYSKFSEPVEILEQKGDYDAFEMVVNTLAYQQENGISWGKNLVGAAGFFIPRQIWPTKPVGTGQLVGGFWGYRFTNLSSPLWAELFLAGGFGLLVIALYGYGRAIRRVEERSLSALGAEPVFLAFWAGFQTLVLRGDLMNSVAYSGPALLMIALFVTDFSVKKLSDRLRFGNRNIVSVGAAWSPIAQ